MEDWRLLREYLDSGSDAAFTALVERHINLVYSAALRRLGDPHAAEDVTQSVFCLLAQKGWRLRAGTVLVGWLYQTACFKASNYRRRELRQRQREREAVLMQSPETTAGPEWEQLEPHLEEAMSGLGETDRLAVLLRYFQCKPLKEVGETLGVSEDAARMRVDRAVIKLRGALAGRGVTFTAAALTAIVAERSVAAAPSGLAVQVSHTAIVGAASGAGVTALILKLVQSLSFKLAAGAVAIALVAITLVKSNDRHGGETEPRQKVVEATPTVMANAEPARPSGAATTVAQPAAAAATSNVMVLQLIAADSGEPVVNAPIDYLLIGTNITRNRLQSTASGLCEVPFPPDSFRELQLTTQVDGFADTRLRWKSGQLLPAEYTLRLTRPVRLGGWVVDPDGQPIAGAEIVVSSSSPEVDSGQPERHVGAKTATDPDGRWYLNRVAPEVFRQSDTRANHPSFVDTQVNVAGDAGAEAKLLAGTHVFRLDRAIAVQGMVVDADGKPVPEATVRVLSGDRGMIREKTVTALADGSFYIPDCKPGKNDLSADAKGFRTATLQVQIGADSSPVRLTLERGFRLRLRLVNQRGEPVTNNPIMITESRRIGLIPGPFRGRTDSEGRLTWEQAPSPSLTLDIRAFGYMLLEGAQLHADGQEHKVTLPPALTISGTVVDAATGEPIPRFRIATGWPVRRDTITNAQWSTLDRFWLNFREGKFQHSYTEPVISGVRHREYVFKFMAEGYAPHVTRVVSMDEVDVRLDIRLRPAADTLVTVLLPDGRPAAHADVGLVSVGVRLEVVPGGLSRERTQSGGAALTTDADGRFRLSADDAITRVIAAHGEGYAEATPSELAANPVWRLQPWGRVEGTWLSNGKPIANRGITIQRAESDPNSFGFKLDAFQTKTDQDGRFVFSKVPAGKQMLSSFIVTEPRSGTVVFRTYGWSDPGELVDVRAGQTTNIVVGAFSHHLTVRLQWPGGRRPANWTVAASVQTSKYSPPPPPPNPQTDPHGFGVWMRNPQNHISQGRKYYFTESTNGSWIAQDVQPGDYLIDVRAWENKAASEHPIPDGHRTGSAPGSGRAGFRSVGGIEIRELPVGEGLVSGQVIGAQAESKLTIREDTPTGTVDLGELVLKAVE